MSASDPDILWGKSGRLARALEMLEEIHAAGYALVPLKPTDAMLTAGSHTGGVSKEASGQIYLAMLHAAGDSFAFDA